jgi:hypothetical protein
MTTVRGFPNDFYDFSPDILSKVLEKLGVGADFVKFLKAEDIDGRMLDSLSLIKKDMQALFEKSFSFGALEKLTLARQYLRKKQTQLLEHLEKVNALYLSDSSESEAN